MPTESTHLFIVLTVSTTLLVAPAISGLIGPGDATPAATEVSESTLPYHGFVPAVQELVQESGGEISFAEAVELSKLGGQHHAEMFDTELRVHEPVPEHDSPSTAVLALSEQKNASLTEPQIEEIQALDDLDAPTRTALTDVIDAFLAFHAASKTAYADLDVDTDQRVSDLGPAGTHEAIGLDLGEVFETRNHLLDALLGLHTALQATDGPALAGTEGTCAPTVAAPFVAFDLDGCDATYTEDVMLSIDVGGNDEYLNKAGAGAWDFAPAAMAVDLGQGDDTYGPAGDVRAVNGAGYVASGFLVDDGGNDTYEGTWAANGGGLFGTGFLMDVGGTDEYTAYMRGVNGGGYQGGSGFLLDIVGDDSYTSEHPTSDWFTGRGSNGGADEAAVGTLIDVVGNDTYNAGSQGTNGGGFEGSVGLLVDLSGDDAYTATEHGANGHAAPGHVLGLNPPASLGLLFDAGGTDTYQDDEGGTGTDVTVLPKGTLGAQVDV